MMFRKKDVIDLTNFKKISDDNIVFISGNLIITKKDDRYDVMTYVKDLAKDKDSDKTDTGSIIAVIVMILVACGIGTGVYFARKNTK